MSILGIDMADMFPGDADIVIVNANDGQMRRTIHVNKKVRKLLGIGRRFALLLLPYVDGKYKNLAVVDLKDKKIIGGYTVPHSRYEADP